MSSAAVRRRAFATRLSQLRAEVIAGLPRRVAELREAVAHLGDNEQVARELLRTYAHRLHGIAGSHGLRELGAAAEQLSACAQMADTSAVARRAEELCQLASALVAAAVKRTAAMPAPTAFATATANGQADGSGVWNGAPQAELCPHGLAAGHARPRVLALDDEPSAAQLLALTLTRLGGFDAVVLRSPRDAIPRLQSERFDLIVSDAMMPDMDGKEFCKRARELDLTRGAKFIILSAATPEELGWSQRDAAYDAWLRKPFRPQPLCWSLQRILGSSTGRIPDDN